MMMACGGQGNLCDLPHVLCRQGDGRAFTHKPTGGGKTLSLITGAREKQPPELSVPGHR